MSSLLKLEEPDATGDAPSLTAFLELGFRPLYLAGAFWAMLAVLIWIFLPQWIVGTLQGVIWHAHEMLWGFVITIAIGFLMTAGANWTGINPLPHRWLFVALALWCVARMAYLLPGAPAFVIGTFSEISMLLLAAIGMGRAVFKSRSQRNYGVPLVLLALALVDAAYLWTAANGDYATLMREFHIGIMFMAMLVLLIGRRVIPFFAMRAVTGLVIPMLTRSGHVQLGLSVLGVLMIALQWRGAAALIIGTVGAISVAQVLLWKPYRVLRKPLLWILYTGYLLTGIGLIAFATSLVDLSAATVWPVHLVAMGGFSVLIIGMITRTALGHLGRPLEVTATIVASYWLVLGAAVFRLSAVAMPSLRSVLLGIAALCWIAAFAMYVREFFPMMIRPRPRPQTIIRSSVAANKTMQ